MIEVTVAPSTIIASKQLQALVAATKAWQGEAALMQQLLGHLAASPSGSSSLTAAGASCWLVNQTGAPLSYVVADAVLDPSEATAALSSCGTASSSNSSSSPPPRPPSVLSAASRAVAGARGQAAHLSPVPLRVLDVSAAGYFGRYVEQAGVSCSMFSLQQDSAHSSGAAAAAGTGAPANGSAAIRAGGTVGVKHSQLLYVQAAGRVEVVGPIALSQLGCSVHPLRGLAAGVASGGHTASRYSVCTLHMGSMHSAQSI